MFVESWEDTHGNTHLRRVVVDPPTNNHRSVIDPPLVGGDSQLTTSGAQHSQCVPATEHQDQLRQWPSIVDISDKTHASLDQAQSTARLNQSDPELRESDLNESDPALRESDPYPTTRDYDDYDGMSCPSLIESDDDEPPSPTRGAHPDHNQDSYDDALPPLIDSDDSDPYPTTPFESDQEYCHTINTRMTVTHWTIVEWHDGPERSTTFDSLEQANSWQEKVHASLRANGWRLHTSTRNPELELTGWCWTRPRPYPSSPADRVPTREPEVKQDRDLDDDQAPELEVEYDSEHRSDDETSCPSGVYSSCSEDSDHGEFPSLINCSPTSDGDATPLPNRGGHDAVTGTTNPDDYESPPPIRGVAIGPNLKVAGSPFNPYHIIWDCAAGSNMCSNADMATDIKPCRRSAIAGIVPGTEVVYTHTCTMLDSEFGRCPLAIGSTGNILAQAAVLDAGFQVHYLDDKFIVSHPSDKDVRYVFGRTTGTYGSTNHYLMDSRTMLPPTSAGISTHTLMGYNLGVYTTTTQDPKSFTPAPPVDRHATDRIKTEDQANGPTLANVSVEARILLVKKERFLFCLLHPIAYSIVVPIETNEAVNIYHALRGVIMESHARGFDIVSIRTDREAILRSALVSDMLVYHSITITTVKDETHMVMTSQRMYLVREEWKTIVMTLRYAPSKHIIQWGVIAANRRANMHTPVGLEWAETPRHTFLGTRTELESDPTGITFGSHVYGPNIHDEGRLNHSESHIFLLAADSKPGKSHMLNLRTNTVVLGYHGKPGPITKKVIQHLNSVALKERYFKHERSPSSFTMRKSVKWSGGRTSVKWSDGSGDKKPRRSLTVAELPPLEPYPLLSTEEYAKLPNNDKTHIRLHNKAIKDAMEKMRNNMRSGEARGGVKPQEQNRCSPAPDATNDRPEDMEGIKHSTGSTSRSPDYPYWSPIGEGAQHVNTRGREPTIIPEAFDGTAVVRRRRT